MRERSGSFVRRTLRFGSVLVVPAGGTRGLLMFRAR